MPRFKTSLNANMLRKIKRHLLAKPARLRMDSWIVKGIAGEKRYTGQTSGYREPAEYVMPKCGTVGCIAGWAVVLDAIENKIEPALGGIDTLAYKILNIDRKFRPFELFYVDYWPEDLKERYYVAGDNQDDRARIVGEVIEIYIAKYAENEKRSQAVES